MSDLEKVILALKCCAETHENIEFEDCQNCPYNGEDHCANAMMIDALAVLKEQTAQWIWDRPHHFRCSECNGVVGQVTHRYCPNCGREMLLSETERRKEWPEEVK